MNDSRMRVLTGEAGVNASAEKAGVNDRDQSTRPPAVSIYTTMTLLLRYILLCEIEKWSNIAASTLSGGVW